MLLTRLYLRNFRVFEDELDLPLPPGLVGIYGPNGAGKSTLLEAILFTLWGRARTSKEEIRSAGVGGDCVTEVEFEHEGHLYVVRRRLSGINATTKASVTCDNLQMSEGPGDTRRYLHSVLGMDDGAFRASVFAEQKQLAAFSGHTPAERRTLVLQLLGVTPLDGARDAVRRDARDAREHHEHLRGMLPDLGARRVAAGDAEAAAGAADAVAAEADAAAATARAGAAGAAAEFARADALRQEHDALVIEGRAARAALDGATAAADARAKELASIDEAASQLGEAERAAAGLAADQALAGPLRSLTEALAVAAATSLPAQPPVPDPSERDAAAAEAEAARGALGQIEGEHRAVAGALDRARAAAERSGGLSGGSDCPLCGQALGEAWDQVRAHRDADVAAAAARLAELDGALDAARARAARALAALRAAAAALAGAEATWSAWDRQQARASEVALAVERACAGVVALGTGPPAQGVDVATLASWSAEVDERIRLGRLAAAAADRLRGRLEGRPAVEQGLAVALDAAATAQGQVTTLRDKVRALGFDAAALERARAEASRAADAATSQLQRAQEARVDAATARAAAVAAATRLADAVAQHALLEQLAVDSLHLGRLADLIAGFRNTVVASVGPRLAVQAAELFAELTDHEYDELQVDPETYGLQISDGGRVYGLERFSGSEVDLANLALRVAISEQIRFQSGGSVGLLVLDEVFGPLDEQRKERMLGALERLRGRFRQVLVVTHDSTIKEQLPNAIEVVKRPGRRATARLLAG